MTKKRVPLADLLAALPDGMLLESEGVNPEIQITGVALDSRQVQPGDLFVALKGSSVDGHAYVDAALASGAVAVAGTRPRRALPAALDVRPYLHVRDGRLALAYFSAALYGFPARRLTVIGVTGTDGKTTTANLIFAILRAAGIQSGMISTVSAVIGDEALDTGFHVTTPEAPDVQRYLAQMVDAGLTHVVLEATSHGLAQQRVAACEFDVGVVTNITHEHLDYHGSYRAYRAAKARLFTQLAHTVPKSGGSVRVAVLNRDDRSYEYLSGLVDGLNAAQTPAPGGQPGESVRVLDYSLQAGGAALVAHKIRSGADGLSFEVEGRTLNGERFNLSVHTPLEGVFNVSNCLAALAATAGALGVDPKSAGRGLAQIGGVPGRMQRINVGQDFLALVDFAHTPNALRRALEAGRELAGAKGRVIAVFGSAGLRDRQKRRMMAETAADLADFSVLTAEDPRTESLIVILDEMAAGAQARGGVEGETFWRIPDRGEALRFAVRLARPGDVLLACGKGHEQSMCFGTIEYPWDDATALRAALAELLSKPGPKMPFLPTRDA